MSVFRKATKKASRLRLAVDGPSGSGKTMSALGIAAGLGSRIAVIDTERGSASLYSDKFDFDVLELGTHDPRNYIDAIRMAEQAGYDVIVIDSLSHAWMGRGGALELVDAAAKRSQSKNTFTAWRDVTPLHNSLVEAMLQSSAHVIATMRTKVEYVLEENERGQKVPVKKGMAPIQREGMDYEFTVVCDLDLDHNLIVGKTRCAAIDKMVVNKPGPAFGKILRSWLEDGEAAITTTGTAATPAPGRPTNATPASPTPPTPVGLAEPETIGRLLNFRRTLHLSDQQWLNALSKRGVASPDRLTAEQAAEMEAAMKARVDKMLHDNAAAAEAEMIAATAGATTLGGQTDPSPADSGFPFSEAAKPEDIARHQEEQATKAVVKTESTAHEGTVAVVSDPAPVADPTPAAVEDIVIADTTRPEKPEPPAKAARGKNGKATVTA